MLRLRKILLLDYLYFVFLIIALSYSFINTKLIKHDSIYTNETNFKGIIQDYEIDGNKLTIIFKDKELIKGTYYFKTKTEKDYYDEHLKYGLTVFLTGELSEPINNTIPNTFNYKEYLNNKKIYKILTISEIKISSNNSNIFYQIKNFINKRIKSLTDNDYVKTFILGDKTGIDDEEFSNYQVLGVTHLFAISGMHIGLFAGVILFILKKFKVGDDKCLIISAIIIGLYGLLTSFPASVRRAYILYLLVVINKINYFNIKTINLLILTVIINIFIDYNIICDIGFLYSLSTTAGLIISHEYLNGGNYIMKLFKVSLIAFLFSLPITINNFYFINPLTPINNIFIVPLVSLIIYPFSLIVFILPFTGFLFKICVNLLKLVEDVLIKVNIFKIIIPKLNPIFIIVYYLFLLLIILKKKRYLIIFIIIMFIIRMLIPLTDSNGYIYFLDIGQGDSAIIISPYRKDVVMIDTGGKLPSAEEDWEKKNKIFKVSDGTITFLYSMGISSIDELILSHGDEDHAGDALNIINNLNVKKITLNQGEKNYLESSLPIKNPYANYNNLIVKNLNFKDYQDENGNSQIDLIKIYNTSVLFMGDAGKIQELDLIKKYKLNIDILKMGHHGSKTSSDKLFLSTLLPKLSIISSGRKNRFNHPSLETINTLNELNLKYLNTQTSGTIEVKINKKTYTIKEYAP